ncbi:early endosome antigen 1 isoform X5 [Silurus meridionalis]|nr:early endosome antigen 1 isoform X5 [Silurus meridionalis]
MSVYATRDESNIIIILRVEEKRELFEEQEVKIALSPLQHLSKMNHELKTELETQRRKHDLANQLVNNLRRSYSEAQDMLGHHEAEIEVLQAKLVSAMAEIIASEQAVARMRSELKLEQSRCHEREEECIRNETTLRAQLRDSEDRLRDVEASLLEKTQALRLLERQQALQRDQHKEVQRLQEKLTEVTKCLIATEEAQALREEREKKEHRCLEENYERERQGLSRRLAESEEKRREAEEQLQEVQEQVETLLRGGVGEKKESEVSEEMLRLQQVLNEQADVIENLRESVRRLEKERDHLTCRCQELVNQIAEADREVGKLQEQLKIEETDYYSLESSYERVSEEFARISRVLREKEEEVRQTKETYEKLVKQKDQDLNEALVKMAALGSSLEETEQRLKAKDELLSRVGHREVEQDLQVKLAVAENRISELEEHLSALRLGFTNLKMERCCSQQDVLDALEEQAEHDISFSTTSSLSLVRSSSETEVSFAKRQRIRFSNIQCQKYHQSQRIEKVQRDNTLIDFTQEERQDLVADTSLNITDDTIQDLSQDISLVSDNTFQYCSDTERFMSIIHALESKLQATEEKLKDMTSKMQNEVCTVNASAEPEQDEPDDKSISCLDDIVQGSVTIEDYKKALGFVESCRVRVREILSDQNEKGGAEAQVHILAEIEKDLVKASLHIRQVATRYEGQIQAVLGPRDPGVLMCNSLSMHEALIQVQVAYVACRLRADHERELSLCQETSHNMATLVQEHAQHVAAIQQRFQSSLEEERIQYFKTINSIQEENETLREEATMQLKEMSKKQKQIVQMEQDFQREIQEIKRKHAEELGRAMQGQATSELVLLERAENTQQTLETLLQDVEEAELRHKKHICKLEHELRGKVEELENVHQEEIQKLHDRYSQTIRTLGERLETIADDTQPPSTTEPQDAGHLEEDKGHEQEVSRDSMSLLRSRVQELELQMMNMRDELENKPPDGDMAGLREKYQRDFDSLKETCERGFAAMEETHQKVIEDLQRQHQREISKLLEEKERLLEEETNATIAAIEAMKNAHREELEKTQRAQLSGVSTDIEQLRIQYEEELQSIHRELEVLSEQYSQKCLENTHLAQALEAERHALQQCQRENQQLHTHNQELNNRLTVEISRMRSCYSGEKMPSPLTQGKDLYELEVLLRIKDSEIQYLKQEINSLKDELQSALRDKKYASDKYKDIYTELSIVRAKADCDISKLREKLLAATEALGERDTPSHTPGYGKESPQGQTHTDTKLQ